MRRAAAGPGMGCLVIASDAGPGIRLLSLIRGVLAARHPP
ncbi:hypothetical protein SUDANB130_06605 [Streptomyces sp. enrichment culture]